MNNIYWLSILSQNGTDVGNFHREYEHVNCAAKIIFLSVSSFLQIYSKIYCSYKVMHNVVPIKLFEVLLLL